MTNQAFPYAEAGRPLEVKVGDRWVIIGATGSGKTWLSREILKFYYRATAGRVPIYILDTKMQGDFKDFQARSVGQTHKGNTLPPILKKTGGKPFVVWQPEEDDFQLYDDFFKAIYQAGKLNRGPAIVYLDELSSITNGAGKAPRYYDILQKQGRGMNIGLVSVTQSPAFIPANLIRQATHMIRMHLNDDYDVKKIVKAMGPEALDDPFDDFGFFYRNCTKPKKKSPAVYYEDMKEFFGLP